MSTTLQKSDNGDIRTGSRFGWYLKKYGPVGLVREVCWRVWRKTFNNDDYVFYCDENDLDFENYELPEGMEIVRFDREEDIPAADIDRIVQEKGDEATVRERMRPWFSRGALLWIARRDGVTMGYIWTVNQGLPGLFFFKLTPHDATLHDADVFPEFRGQRVMRHLTMYAFQQLRKEGINRMYCSCKAWNKTSFRGISNMGWTVFARVHFFKPFGRPLVIWSRHDERMPE